VMFCAFGGPPRIIRFHGRAEVLLPGAPEFDELSGRFASRPGSRSVIRVAVERISDSCGFGVPEMSFERERTELDRWARRQGTDGLVDYKSKKNAVSIDGLPGLGPA
jgi:hypothetical protein